MKFKVTICYGEEHDYRIAGPKEYEVVKDTDTAYVFLIKSAVHADNAPAIVAHLTRGVINGSYK